MRSALFVTFVRRYIVIDDKSNKLPQCSPTPITHASQTWLACWFRCKKAKLRQHFNFKPCRLSAIQYHLL